MKMSFIRFILCGLEPEHCVFHLCFFLLYFHTVNIDQIIVCYRVCSFLYFHKISFFPSKRWNHWCTVSLHRLFAINTVLVVCIWFDYPFRLGSDRRGFQLFYEIVGNALCEGAIIRTEFDNILASIFIYTVDRQYRSWFCSITNYFMPHIFQ